MKRNPDNLSGQFPFQKKNLLNSHFYMKTCRACLKSMPDNARFCPHCGTGVIEETITCPKCGEENRLHDRFCEHCGNPLFKAKEEAPKPPPDTIFDNSHLEKIQQEIANQFSKAFNQRLEEEHHAALHDTFRSRFLESDFKRSVDFRIQQLAEEALQLKTVGTASKKNIERIRFAAFEELLDYFIIRYCDDLSEAMFPETILKYQGLPLDKINPGVMVADYLDFESEEETVYSNFVTMPASKLKNAAQSFLFPKKGETIFFICDQSVLGTCKEGFAMTNECIYWKAILEKPQRVFYKNLDEIRRQENWIVINGIFFNSNKSLNLKLLRLLKKLRTLFGKQ